MKKIILMAFLLCSFNSLFSQNRIMTINNGLAKLGINKIQMNTFLKNKGFKLVSSSDGCYSYALATNDDKRTIMVCYKNSKVNALAWNENKAFINVAFPEVQSEKFMLMTDNPYYHFVNSSKRQQINLIQRPNDLFISVGMIEE